MCVCVCYTHNGNTIFTLLVILGFLVCSSVNSIGINKEQGVSLLREWMNFEIQASCQGSRETSLSALRKKVRKHALSRAHAQAVKMAELQKKAVIEKAMEAMTECYIKGTKTVFRTAYHLAKKNRPFSDHESLIELQELNGLCCTSFTLQCNTNNQTCCQYAMEPVSCKEKSQE